MPLNGVATYNVTVSNIGSAPASNVTVVETLPTGLQFTPGWGAPTGAAAVLRRRGIVVIDLLDGTICILSWQQQSLAIFCMECTSSLSMVLLLSHAPRFGIQ